MIPFILILKIYQNWDLMGTENPSNERCQKYWNFLPSDLTQTHTHTHIGYLSMKEGSLFCFVVWDLLNQDASDHVLGVFGKLLTRRGEWAWFHDVWTWGAKVLEYWMISSLKIKINCSWMGLVPWCLGLRCKSSWTLNDLLPED